MLDMVVVLPEIQALDESVVSVIINTGFNIVDRAFHGSTIEPMKAQLQSKEIVSDATYKKIKDRIIATQLIIDQMKFWLIEAIDNRVGEIEKGLLEKRNTSHEPVEKSGTSGSPLRQFLNDIIRKHNETTEQSQILVDEQMAKLPNQDTSNGNVDQTARQELKIPGPVGV